MTPDLNSSLAIWLQLASVPKLSSNWIAAYLYQHKLSPQQLWHRLLNPKPQYQLGLSPAVLKSCRQLEMRPIEQALAWQQQVDCSILSWDQPLFPKYLYHISNPPLVLYVKGDPTLLNLPQIAIVGSRKPTPVTCERTTSWAMQLAQRGLVITSGLAAGCDACAHRGALAQSTHPAGSTIAVLGHGLGQIYPTKHTQLAQDIVAQGGALVSEFQLQQPPRRAHFPQRNRIISGLTLGTVVMQAGLRSGSLITARLALQQNRELMVVPCSPGHPNGDGALQLLQQGAAVVTQVDDIMDLINPACWPDWMSHNTYRKLLPAPSRSSPPTATDVHRPSLSPQCQRLLACLDEHSCSLELLVQRSGLTLDQIHVSLQRLQMAGYVQSELMGYIKTAPHSISLELAKP